MRITATEVTRLGATLCLLLAAPLILAPTPCNLRIAEYPGSSVKEGREDTSDVFEVEHHVQVPFDPATGQAAGVKQHNPLVVVKIIDKATPGFHKALTTGENLQNVILHWYRIDPVDRIEVEYYRITLTQARIVDIRPYMPMSFLPANESYGHMEQVSFVYEEIEWNWIPDGFVEMDRWRAPSSGRLQGKASQERRPEQQDTRLARRAKPRGSSETEGAKRAPLNDRRVSSRAVPVDTASKGG